MALADPAALKESLWYEPTGSKLYTAPFPEKETQKYLITIQSDVPYW